MDSSTTNRSPLATSWPSATLTRVTTACIGLAITPEWPSSSFFLSTWCRPWPRSGCTARFAVRDLAPPVRLATMSAGTVSVTLRLSTSITKVSLASSVPADPEVPAVPAMSAEAGCPPLAESASLFRYLRSSHFVLTLYSAPCSAVNSSSVKMRANSSAGVGTPSILSSPRARRTRATALARFDAVTMSLPIMESNFGDMVSPSTTPESTRIPGPDGHSSAVSVPELGVRFFDGSSQVNRSSKLCPRNG